MAAYYRKTLTIFWQSFKLGSALSGGWFLFYPNSLDEAMPTWLPIRFVPFFKVATAFLAPAIILFFGLRMINWLLIRTIASEEIAKRREEIMVKLVDSLVSKDSIPYRKNDLLDKHAWKSLKPFWRLK